MTTLTPGLRLYSATSAAEFIVVKGADVTLTCGGAAMVTEKPELSDSARGEPLGLGKRYTDEESGLLLLCTKPGLGPLVADGREMTLVAAKALPSSD